MDPGDSKARTGAVLRPRTHLQEEADFIHALVLTDEGLEKQIERLHGLLVQHLQGQRAACGRMTGAWPASPVSLPGQHPCRVLARSLGNCPRGGPGHASRRGPRWVTTRPPGWLPSLGEDGLLGRQPPPVCLPPLQHPTGGPCPSCPLFALNTSISQGLVPLSSLFALLVLPRDTVWRRYSEPQLDATHRPAALHAAPRRTADRHST